MAYREDMADVMLRAVAIGAMKGAQLINLVQESVGDEFSSEDFRHTFWKLVSEQKLRLLPDLTINAGSRR